MLESLFIRNYAIIDEMTVTFPGGFTVITGETGAGKSIVVDALELLLGARASSEMIRAGTDEIEITGVFSLDESLASEDLPDREGGGVLIIRRGVRADGAGRCYINDTPVTLKKVKAIGDRLVDLHGQHDHQSLLDVAGHVVFLDGFGGLASLVTEVGELFDEFVTVRAAIGKLKLSIENARRDRELFRFQIKEIDDAKLVPGEDETVKEAISRLSRATELKALCMREFQALSESEGSVEEVLGGLTGDLEDLSRSDPGLCPFTGRMEEMASGISDLADELRRYGDGIDEDPEALFEVETRLALIEQLKKKYGPALDDIFAYRERISRSFDGIENDVQTCEKFEIRLEEIKPKLLSRARALSSRRKEIAPALSSEVESHLAELGMKDARLVVDITGQENGETLEEDGQTVVVGRGGIDRVEFMFSANPGVPPRPLARIASGGEVSRVMLSLKLALSAADAVPTMVFDEIDSGVSGRVAEAVGDKLLRLSKNRQVIVITHLPQIAGKAGCHFSARKSVQDGTTRANLVPLDDAMRQEELAAMLSGVELTESARAQARELLKKRQKAEGRRQKG